MAPRIFDTLKFPPVARTLGWTLRELNPVEGEIEVGFSGRREFSNPTGHIQGGILSAMLDDTMGPVIVAHTNGSLMGQTINLHTHFIKPVPVGNIWAKARLRRMGSRIAFLEGELFDGDGTLAATASAAMMLSRLDH